MINFNKEMGCSLGDVFLGCFFEVFNFLLPIEINLQSSFTFVKIINMVLAGIQFGIIL